MAEKNFCSRETVLNYLMDRHRITYEEIEKKTGKGDTKELMQMVNDCMVFFVESDIPFEDRVEWVLDRMCRFLEAEASYFVLYGRSRSIYASSVLRNDEKAKPKSEEFSLLLNTRLKNSFKPGRFCFLEDLKKIKYDDREVYNKLSFLGVKNELLMPVFCYSTVVGFVTVYNIEGSVSGLGFIQNMLNLIATTGNELESAKFKNLQLARIMVGESNEGFRAEARKKEKELNLAKLICGKLSRPYRYRCVIDMENIREVFSDKESGPDVKSPEEAQTAFDRMTEGIKHGEFRKGLGRFLQLSDLRMRLGERDEISFEYIDNDDHWCKCSFYSLTRDDRGAAAFILYVEENSDREKQGTEDRMHFMRTVSDHYLAVYRIDLDTCEVVTVKPFERTGRFENFKDNLQQMMNIWVAEYMYPEASKADRDFFNMSTLSERLASSGSLSLEVNSTRLGWVKTGFKIYSKGAGGEVKSVLWLTESIIDEKRYDVLNWVISETYMVLAYVSLSHKRYKTLIRNRRTAEILPEEESLETAIGHMRLNVSDEHREKVMEFMDPNTLDERMRDEKTISVDYINDVGEWARASVTKMTEDNGGKIDHIVFSIQIIDESKRKELEREAAIEWAYEEAKQASETKSGFFSNLSHDIRTPMNAIVGMTRIAMENLENRARVEDCLEKIRSSSDHLLALINDSLDLSRIESGKIEIAHESVNLREMENNFMSIMQGYMVDRRLEIITDCKPPAVDCVLTDGLRLRQVVMNILSNAIKYTPDGKNIIFRSENYLSPDKGKLHVKYVIADSGIGMTQDFLKKIYEPFSQVERDGVHSKYKGTGLGMLIVKNFVDMLGGTIDIQSEVNVGTVVTLNFDFDVDFSPVTHNIAEVKKIHKNVDLKNIKVLLVEDNDINREIAKELLMEMHMDIVEATDGEDAVYKFRASSIGELKCIFMDIMMPLMNGYEATKAIRTMNRDDAKTIPIIAMTANAFMEDVKMAKECGMNEHISKPIDPDHVKEIVERFLVK